MRRVTWSSRYRHVSALYWRLYDGDDDDDDADADAEQDCCCCCGSKRLPIAALPPSSTAAAAARSSTSPQSPSCFPIPLNFCYAEDIGMLQAVSRRYCRSDEWFRSVALLPVQYGYGWIHANEWICGSVAPADADSSACVMPMILYHTGTAMVLILRLA